MKRTFILILALTTSMTSSHKTDMGEFGKPMLELKLKIQIATLKVFLTKHDFSFTKSAADYYIKKYYPSPLENKRFTTILDAMTTLRTEKLLNENGELIEFIEALNI